MGEDAKKWSGTKMLSLAGEATAHHDVGLLSLK